MAGLPPNPIQFRAVLAQREAQLVKSLPPLPSTLTEEYLTIPGPKKLKVTRPTSLPSSSNTPTTAPLILLFHGGGFMGGTIEQLTRPAREFAGSFGAIVVSAPYKLIPEHPFPGSVEDAYDTLLWVAHNAATHFPEVDLKEKGLVVGGMSAGGNIAAVLAPLSIQRGDLPPGVKITGSFLTIPSLLVPAIVPAEYTTEWTSREDNKEGNGVLSTDTVNAILALLAPDPHSPLFSPFNSPDDVLRQLPRTYIQVGGTDCLRDDGIVYEKLLRAKGVEVKLDVYPNLGHIAYSIFTQDGDEKEAELKEKTLEAMKWLLRL